MKPNPVLKRLGLRDTDRVAVLHADDVGMCQASVEAFRQLDEFGLVACGAVMVPCPWAPVAGAYARANPRTDLGVHLTLTSEWQHYRWGPISTRDAQSGLMDDEGFFPRRSDALQASADPTAARRELEMQVERAIAMGIDVSHVDTHMGTVLHPKLLPAYMDIALKRRIPGMIFRWDEATLMHQGLDGETAGLMARQIEALEANGVPLLDGMFGMPLDQPDQQFERAKQAFANLPAGLTHFIIHPSVDTPELREIANDWRARVGNFETFMREDLRAYIEEIGVTVIGYKTLRELMRAG
jgi:chitin disaccharide deacetylase